MLHLVCAMAYGDCLITLSLLEKLDLAESRYRILGTGVTKKVSSLLKKPLPVLELLPDKAAFYTIQERGPVAAIKDFLQMRRKLGRLCQPGDRLAFERRDLRNLGLLPTGCEGIYGPRSSYAYADRRDLVRSLFGTIPDWKPALTPDRPVQRVLINPCARYHRRWLSTELMTNVVELSRRRRWQLTLIDPCGEYSGWASQVQEYLPRPQLEEAARRLRNSDLYIGPDSFFIHLAYYFHVPHFGFFYPDHLYFMTPGMRELGGYLSFSDAADYSKLERGVLSFTEQAM